MTEEDKEKNTKDNEKDSGKKKKYQKSRGVWLMIILIVAGGIYVASDSQGGDSETNEEIAKCIADKSTLYIQLGCHACETQEEIFGDSYKYLDTVDCFYEQDKCIEKDITATPTWIINGEKYTGYKEIGELKNLSGC